MNVPPFRQFALAYPCFVAVAGILNASFLWLLLPDVSVSLLPLAMLPGMLTVWLLLGSREALLKFVLPSLLVLSSIYLLEAQRDRSFESFLNGNFTGGEIVAELNDSSLCGGTPDWLKNAPPSTEASVKRFRYTPSDSWKATSGKVFLRLPREMPFAPGYGDVLFLSGYFERIDSLPVPGAFDYESYARVRGIGYTFTAGNALLIRGNRSLLRSLYDFRGYLLNGFGKGMGSAESKMMSSALLFGMKQGVDPQTKNDFLRSGTIHVLSVSGLHVGLFFGVLILFMRIFPFAVRWFLVLIPVFVYTLSTGMQGPAFRAFAMFAVWCILRAFLLKTKALNTVAFAAVLLMLWNPAVSLDIGFQYSFICVLFLLYSSDFLSGVRLAMMSKWKYSMTEIPRFRRWTIGFLTMSTGASFVAYLSSFGISMLHQGLFSPYAVPAYILMSPLAWLCFAIFVFGVLFCWIPGVLFLCGVVMSPMLAGIRTVSRIFAEDGYFYTMRSPWWLVLIFMALLIAVLSIRRRRLFAWCAVVLILIMFGSLTLPLFMKPELLVVNCGEQRPMLILTSPASSRGVVINVPDYECARAAVSFLRTRGIQDVDELFFESARRESCEGGRSFLLLQSVRVVVFPAEPRANAGYAKKTLQTAFEKGILHSRFSGFFDYSEENSVSRFRCSGPWKGIELVLRNRPEGGVELEIWKNKQQLRKSFIPLNAEKNVTLYRL